MSGSIQGIAYLECNSKSTGCGVATLAGLRLNPEIVGLVQRFRLLTTVPIVQVPPSGLHSECCIPFGLLMTPEGRKYHLPYMVAGIGCPLTSIAIYGNSCYSMKPGLAFAPVAV